MRRGKSPNRLNRPSLPRLTLNRRKNLSQTNPKERMQNLSRILPAIKASLRTTLNRRTMTPPTLKWRSNRSLMPTQKLKRKAKKKMLLPLRTKHQDDQIARPLLKKMMKTWKIKPKKTSKSKTMLGKSSPKRREKDSMKLQTQSKLSL